MNHGGYMTKVYNHNPTTRTFPRTLAEAFPRTPNPDFEEEGLDGHKVLEIALIGFLVALPVLLWVI